MRHFLSVMLAVAVLVIGAGAQTRSAAELSAAGWDAIAAGRAQDAAMAFAEALKLAPQKAPLLLGAGVAAQMQGRSDEARRFLIDALKVDPTLTTASLALGEVLYQSGDIDGAIDTYQQALAHAPANERIAKKLEAWRKESALHSRFGQKLGDHFTVLFEGPAEADLAARAVAILESAYWRIGAALYTYPADVITVVLYTREQFRDITQSPAWAGGAFDGRIRMPVQGALENPREFERVLSHEFTHALIRSLAARGVPYWLDEGLAVQFEGSDINKKREQLRGAATLMPLTRLEKSFAGLDVKDATLAYAESAVAVQTLLDDAGAPAVISLIEDIGRGLPFAEAFQRNTLISYSDFQKKLQY